MNANLLLVEDDPTLLRVLSDTFHAKNYRVTTASDGEKALEAGLNQKFDIIILDVMLPFVNGYEICRYLRAENVETPIIFLTAKSEESDILLGLGLGGDDYLAKPFSIKELLARIEAVLRRTGPAEKEQNNMTVCFGDFELDQFSHKLRNKDGTPVKLSPKEYDLLAFLIQHSGEALSRQKIMDSVWGYDSRVTFRSIDRFITTLRKKIELETGRHIETIREFGYRFKV
ncbi:MAG: response regulator transcription factor [Verrucomicrobiales bacterium]|nr:response regulator transcription factor [Verrucomicrobiales bacterium]